MSQLIYFLIFISTFSYADTCGKDTRKERFSITCKDLETNTEYSLVVNKMCGTLNGKQQPLLEIEEHRPNLVQQQWKLFKNDVDSFMYKQMKALKDTKDKKIQLFSQRAGKEGKLTAFGIPSEDGKKLETLELMIHPNGGPDCTKQWKLPADIWNENY